MPNILAYIVLFGWPLVVVILFRRLPLPAALAWSVVAGYLLLPLRAGFDLPLLPTVGKTLVLSLSAGVMCLIALRGRGTNGPGPVPPLEIRRGQTLYMALLGLLVASPFLTVLQNAEAIFIGDRVLPGIRPYDAFSIISGLLVALLPFLLGRRFLADADSQRILLRVLVLACLAYSVLILYEVRMSPQLNRMLYGFFPHSFAQHIRGDGFRPLVFMSHGLWLAIFVATGTLSALALWRDGTPRATRQRWLLAGLYLLVVLVLCRSLGALALTLLFAPLMLFAPRKTQLLLAAVVAGIVLIYPMMRGADLVPVDTIYRAAERINPARAGSFQTRLVNEDRLLAHAQRKPLAGWGSWGRNRVYNEDGRDITTTDGYWIIVVSTFGWLGYIAQFGLLTVPLLMLGLQRNRLDLSFATSGLALILGVGLIDLIPNATISPVLWLMAGSMMGRFQTATTRSEAQPASNAAAADSIVPKEETVPKIRYRRPLGKPLSRRSKGPMPD